MIFNSNNLFHCQAMCRPQKIGLTSHRLSEERERSAFHRFQLRVTRYQVSQGGKLLQCDSKIVQWYQDTDNPDSINSTTFKECFCFPIKWNLFEVWSKQRHKCKIWNMIVLWCFDTQHHFQCFVCFFTE